jgi:hypothetical protein
MAARYPKSKIVGVSNSHSQMFEHLRNYQQLTKRIASWLRPEAPCLCACSRTKSTPIRSNRANASDWMARHFFTGGPMPGDDLLPHFQGDLKLEQHWKENGKNYFYTAKAWLQNTDQNREQILAMFVGVYGKENALAWLVRRRIFLWRARNYGAFAGVTNGSCRTIVSWPPRTAKSFVKPQRGRERSASPGK